MSGNQIEKEPQLAQACSELELPKTLDSEYFKDLDFTTADRFCYLTQHYHEKYDAVFGNNEPLLDGSVRSSPDSSVITFDGAHSCLWSDHNHVTRQFSSNSEDLEKDSKTLPEAQIRSALLPWERWRGGLTHTEPTIRDGFTQAIGLKFPVLNLKPGRHDFRLLMLLPSLGDTESPLQGCLIVSTLYLHSCFRALRHSRGNPGFWGSMVIDGETIEITKNLEVFLRHARHPCYAQMFYIRELCINRQDVGEREALLTGQFHALVEDCSCGVIDVNKAMHQLDGKGLVPEPARSSEKCWDYVPDSDRDSPGHLPLLLRYYNSNPLFEKADITEEEISRFDDYEYVPTDLAAREIRLLGIYPTENSSNPIVVDVAYIPLRMNVSYHALSYVWGSPKITRYLKSGNTKIGVPENLYSALHALREQILHKDGGPCYFWVDAICIDQSNGLEKHSTIRRMHDIFDGATSVQISIAPTDLLTQPAVSILQEFAADMEKMDNPDLEMKEQASLESWTDLFLLFQLPYFGRRWVSDSRKPVMRTPRSIPDFPNYTKTGLLTVYKIVQEIASASAPHVMMGGSHARALRTLTLAASVLELRFSELFELWSTEDHPILQQSEELSQCLSFKTTKDRSTSFTALSKIRHNLRRVQWIDYIRHMRLRGEPSSFLFLAILTQSSRCADSRDVLCCLWNICRERSACGLPLDFEGSTEECYVNFTKFYVKYTYSLDIVCIAQSRRRHDEIQSSDNAEWESELDIPSWCPDYRYGGDVGSLIRCEFVTYGIRAWPNMDFAPFHADRLNPGDQATPAFHFADSNLTVQGVVLDSVAYVSEIPFEILPWTIAGCNFETLLKAEMLDEILSRVTQGPGATSLVPSDSQICNDLVNMLTGETGVTETKLEVSEDDNGMKSYSYEYSDKSPNQELAHIYERSAAFTRGRHLIVTENGYMGLAPAYIKEGYKLGILLGCSVPVLLEQIVMAKSKEGEPSRMEASQVTWKLKGDCFVQHWMQGQMMRKYGQTTEEAWKTLSDPAFELYIQ